MSGKEKENQEDLREWLLSFERLVGKPVVVTLLIEKKKIDFITCWNKKIYKELSDTDEEGDSNPNINLEKTKKEIKSLYLEQRSYIR